MGILTALDHPDDGQNHMDIFFSVGEPSGDQHAAHLIGELKRRRPDLTVRGYGGPLMQRAGCRLLYPMTNLAVMGFLQVVPLLWRFIKLYRQAKSCFRESRPDAVILVDFPGFNWWIARAAKAAGIPVFYYLPPQLWAWASWRVRRMRRFVDHVLCGLPFEKQWYADRGIHADYVGHPFFDEVAEYPLDQEFITKWSPSPSTPLPLGEGLGVRATVGILPGSRRHEVTRNWPLMMHIIRSLHAQHPDVRFLVACYRKSHRKLCETLLNGRRTCDSTQLPIHFFVGKTPEIIETADCCVMVSGSVSLEMLARKTPAAVLYRCSRLFYSVMRHLVSVEFITLPNLIAGREVLPEWVIAWSPRRDVRSITRTLDGWLSDHSVLANKVEELSALHQEVVQVGATSRAADVILDRLSGPARSHTEAA